MPVTLSGPGLGTQVNTAVLLTRLVGVAKCYPGISAYESAVILFYLLMSDALCPKPAKDRLAEDTH